MNEYSRFYLISGESQLLPRKRHTAQRMARDEDETKRLRKEVAQLKQEVEILKKATAYFAKEVM